MPDRLPSLILLVGCWVPPAMVGWAAADMLVRGKPRLRPTYVYAAMALLVIGWSAAWFRFQVHRMPPYIPGATMDPTYASPEAIAGLAIMASVVVLPLGALACTLAFRHRRRAASPERAP